MNTVEKLLNMDAGKLKMPSSTFELYCKKLFYYRYIVYRLYNSFYISIAKFNIIKLR